MKIITSKFNLNKIMNTKIITLMVIILAAWGCKDDCPTPDQHITGNGGSTKKSHYTLSGKIINGTYNTPVNPGMKVALRVNYQGVFDFQTEELGNTTIQPDGSFSITYPHSKLAENYGANMRLEGGNMTIEYLPKNRDVDTILYRSTWGGGVIHLKDIGGPNKIYYAYVNHNDSLISGISENNEVKFIDFRYPMPRFNVFYDTKPLDYDMDRKGFRGNPKSKGVDLKGDPFTDTLRIEY
jgi:hypothetical protein